MQKRHARDLRSVPVSLAGAKAGYRVTCRAVQLTEFGEVHARHARAALHDVADLASGSLRVAMMPTFAVYLSGSLIDAFHVDFPNVALTIDAMPQGRIEALLADERLDAGFAFAYRDPSGGMTGTTGEWAAAAAGTAGRRPRQVPGVGKKMPARCAAFSMCVSIAVPAAAASRAISASTIARCSCHVDSSSSRR